jgi:Subtilase family
MSWSWTTHDLASPGDVDPWIEWCLRRGPITQATRQVLCQRSTVLTPAAMRALGWQVPQTYGDSAEFFTARCASQASCDMPQGAIGFVSGDEQLFPQAALQARPGAMPSSKRAMVAAAAPTAAPSTGTVIAVIDADIAFLHRQFRDGDGRSRVRAHWDQGTETNVEPWQTPHGLGYGRELLRADIDAAISGGISEREAYARLGVALPGSGWSHGTQVLSLAAGRSPGRDDAAAASPLVTVSVPRRAFAQTHGLWLNVYLLDALHYILSHVGNDERVVVNVSLGAHSGPHNGHSLLERALDRLIDAYQGRLNVVLAAGNSRLARAHARASWPAQGGAAPSLSAAITMADDDPTPNFVEAWIDGRASDVRIEVTPPPSVAASSGEVAPGRVACLSDSAGHVVAMAYCGKVQASGAASVQALMAVAATRAVDGAAPGTARAGSWTLRVGATAPVAMQLWVARDDSIDHGLEPKAFAHLQPADAVSVAGTMSSICGARRPIVVGGYVLDADGLPTMYEPSGEAAASTDDAARTEPDLCALARVPPALWVGCFSDETPPTPWRLEGTSIAAPYAARALVSLIAQHGVLTRDALMQRLRRTTPVLGVKPISNAGWTSTYWLPCELTAPATSASAAA